MVDKVRQGIQAYRSVVTGLVLPVTLASCFMNAPAEQEAVINTPPPGGNGAPQISGNAPRVVKVGVTYSFTPQATDPDGDSLSFSISNKPMWASFDKSKGSISGVPLLGHEGTYNDIAISVSDGLMSTSLPPFSVSVEPSTAPNMPPEIDGTPAPSVIVGNTYTFMPAGTDPDGDPLTYSILNMPSWATFNVATGRLAGTPLSNDIAMYGKITISVSDGTMSTSLPEFSINVIAANSPPQINGTPSSSVNVAQSYSFTPVATDPDGDQLTYYIQNMPRWAQFDTANGMLFGTPQAGDEGVYTNISIGVSDGNLNDTLPGFTITVNQMSLGSATLSWTPPTQNVDGSNLTDLAGFKIYYGTSPGNYTSQIMINNPGITSYVVNNLTPNTWYFVTTSFNTTGLESDFSNAASKAIN